jgi:hypothetical protein
MRRIVWLGVLALTLAAIPVGASTFLAMSHGELVAQSDAVIQGRVLKVSSFWDPTGRVIQSEALVQVEDLVKGTAPSVVVVRTFGGRVGNFVVEAHGFPKFVPNDHVLLFLHGANATAEVTGYQLGHYKIVRDHTGAEIAVPTFDGGEMLLSRDGRPTPAPKAMRLDALKNMIRAEVERPNTGRNTN